MIAEAVLDLEMHERLLGNGGYRPSGCPRCGGPMHIHEYRERLMLGDPRTATEIAIFRCADRERCGAVTRVVPAFLARHLWRAWSTVDKAVAETRQSYDEPAPAARAGPIPERTVRRWRTRLAASAAALIVVLGTAMSTVPELHLVVQEVRLDGTRAELVTALAALYAPSGPLATTAAVIHRLSPGVRLM